MPMTYLQKIPPEGFSQADAKRVNSSSATFTSNWYLESSLDTNIWK